jgi:hypothetical protein
VTKRASAYTTSASQNDILRGSSSIIVANFGSTQKHEGTNVASYTHVYFAWCTLTGAALYIYLQATSPINDLPEVAAQVTAMLVQLDTDPLVNTGIIQIIELTLL